jgi:hypothetical protein
MLRKMMVIKIIRGVLLGLLLGSIYIGCTSGSIKPEAIHKVPSTELEKYRKIVQEISNNKLGTKDFTIGFIKAPKKVPNLLGRCTFILNNFNKEIDIVESAWYDLGYAEKIILIAHEFKHCECNMYYHIKDKYSDDCPKNIMNEHLPIGLCIVTHLNDYMADIRRGCED